MKQITLILTVLTLLACKKEDVSPETSIIEVESNYKTVIYLNFEGKNIVNTDWNSIYNIQQVNCAPSSFTNNQKQQIYDSLIKYLQTFHIRLTVRRDIYENANQKAEIVVTPTSYWAKIDGMGIAAVNSLTYNIPAFVFSDVSNNNIRNTALAIAHEVGHIVGLNHTKTNNSFYNSSFMGYPYLSSNPIWTEEDKQIINQNLQ